VVLFLIYINDIDENIVNRLWKFADDTKMMGSASTTADVEIIRKDIRSLQEWSEKWLLDFNIDKCKVMHMGPRNGCAKYDMNGKVLVEVSEEKDLGVVVSNDMKVAKQCAEAAKTGNKVLGMISRTFSCKSKNIIKRLYKSLVRPHLDYCIQAWRPHLYKDKEVLEKVQKRATRMVEGWSKLEYEERLRRIGLTNLELRRERADLLEMFKLMRGMEGLGKGNFFTELSVVKQEGVSTRGHSQKIFKERFKKDVGKFSFGNRGIDSWNSLNEEIVEQVNINGFKGKLDQYLSRKRGFK
jgi:hypothetical protein